jgi:Synergist-CTERM protein sorting domain-containing protein
MKPTTYDSDRKLAVFTTTHLSLYAVTYTPARDSGGGCGAGAGAEALLAAMAFAAVTRRKKID